MSPAHTVAHELGQAVSRIQSVVRRHLAHEGISLAGARTLSTLDREGPHRLTDLAILEQVAQPSMSALVARLEAQGLVERRPDPGDGRLVIVSITDHGRALVRGILDRRTELIARRLGELNADERAAIERALPALNALLARMEDRAAVGSRS